MLHRYNIPSYQSIFDAMASISVPIDKVVSILQDNGYSLDTDFSDGKVVIEYDSDFVVIVKGGQKVIKPSIGISAYTTNSTQNIFDVCLMTYGDINKVVLMISQNPQNFNSINSKVGGVTTVSFKDSDVTDNGFKLALKKGIINISTGDVDIETEGFLLQENGFYLLLESGGRIFV